MGKRSLVRAGHSAGEESSQRKKQTGHCGKKEFPFSTPEDGQNIIVNDTIRSFYWSDSVDEIMNYYRKYQVVHIRGCKSGNASVKADLFGINAIQRLYAAARDMVRETFTIETASKDDCGWSMHTPDEILGTSGAPPGDWYTSFIAQDDCGQDSTHALQQFRNSLPLDELTTLFGSTISMNTTAPIWLFIGRNSRQKAMLVGRPEHTDDVSHDGTWHYQAKGSKIWYLRPAESSEWGNGSVVVKNSSSKRTTTFPESIERLKVVVNEGDVIMLNTRLWWHQTRIPFTSKRGFSISYAKDFFSKQLRLSKAPNEDDCCDHEHEIAGNSYQNVDGLYASRAVCAGETVLTEAELPDCVLPRSDDPTCEIAWLDDGTGALLALKDLQAGDWLTVAPSSDEEEDSNADSDEVDCSIDCSGHGHTH